MKPNYGERLKDFRRSLGLTLEKFAKTIGVSKATVINYEKNETVPDISTVGKMVSEFGLNVHWLITGESEMFLEKDKGRNGLSPMDLIQKLYPGIKIDDNLLEILEAAADPVFRNEMVIAVILAKQKYREYFADKTKNEGGNVIAQE